MKYNVPCNTCGNAVYLARLGISKKWVTLDIFQVSVERAIAALADGKKVAFHWPFEKPVPTARIVDFDELSIETGYDNKEELGEDFYQGEIRIVHRCWGQGENN
jgi:hypothetical protein